MTWRAKVLLTLALPCLFVTALDLNDIWDVCPGAACSDHILDINDDGCYTKLNAEFARGSAALCAGEMRCKEACVARSDCHSTQISSDAGVCFLNPTSCKDPAKWYSDDHYFTFVKRSMNFGCPSQLQPAPPETTLPPVETAPSGLPAQTVPPNPLGQLLLPSPSLNLHTPAPLLLPHCSFAQPPKVPYYWDANCKMGDLGCLADGIHVQCRFCGENAYARTVCPGGAVPSTTSQTAEHYSAELFSTSLNTVEHHDADAFSTGSQIAHLKATAEDTASSKHHDIWPSGSGPTQSLTKSGDHWRVYLGRSCTAKGLIMDQSPEQCLKNSNRPGFKGFFAVGVTALCLNVDACMKECDQNEGCHAVEMSQVVNRCELKGAECHLQANWRDSHDSTNLLVVQRSAVGPSTAHKRDQPRTHQKSSKSMKADKDDAFRHRVPGSIAHETIHKSTVAHGHGHGHDKPLGGHSSLPHIAHASTRRRDHTFSSTSHTSTSNTLTTRSSTKHWTHSTSYTATTRETHTMRPSLRRHKTASRPEHSTKDASTLGNDAKHDTDKIASDSIQADKEDASRHPELGFKAHKNIRESKSYEIARGHQHDMARRNSSSVAHAAHTSTKRWTSTMSLTSHTTTSKITRTTHTSSKHWSHTTSHTTSSRETHTSHTSTEHWSQTTSRTETSTHKTRTPHTSTTQQSHTASSTSPTSISHTSLTSIRTHTSRTSTSRQRHDTSHELRTSASIEFHGSLSFPSQGTSEHQAEVGAEDALLNYLRINARDVTSLAASFEARELTSRRLTEGNWRVSYELRLFTAQAAEVEEKARSLVGATEHGTRTIFLELLRKSLTHAGAALADDFQLSSFSPLVRAKSHEGFLTALGDIERDAKRHAKPEAKAQHWDKDRSQDSLHGASLTKTSPRDTHVSKTAMKSMMLALVVALVAAGLLVGFAWTLRRGGKSERYLQIGSPPTTPLVDTAQPLDGGALGQQENAATKPPPASPRIEAPATADKARLAKQELPPSVERSYRISMPGSALARPTLLGLGEPGPRLCFEEPGMSVITAFER